MATPIKLSPLNATAEKLGARWQEVAGWRAAQSYGDVAAETTAALLGLALTDVSHLGKIQIEGANAAALLAAALGAAPQAFGASVHVSAGDAYCLRPDMYFMLLPAGTEEAMAGTLFYAAAGRTDLVTVNDLTHGLAGLELVGPRALEVLTRVCGLDFDDTAFPNGSARQSSVAKTKQTLLRQDRGALPAYRLFGARSLAAYLWGVLMEAGRPFGIRAVGLEALEQVAA